MEYSCPELNGIAGLSKKWCRRLSVTTVFISLNISAHGTNGAEPGVWQSNPPHVQDADVQSLKEVKPVKEWKPGDPVRVMNDLKEDSESTKNCESQQTEQSPEPIVRKPVTPQVTDEDLSNLPKKKPYKPGDPVRVIPDLKKSDSKTNSDQ